MDLLIFAHRGEAQEFIKKLSLKAVDSSSSFYKDDCEKFALLITGEGIYEVFTKLGPVLGKHNFNMAYNLGIAGSLSKNIAIDEVIYPRTVYCESEKLHFQSYTIESDSQVDMITSTDRVLEKESAQKLSCFAPTVDRELWAVAKLCHETKIPLKAIKLISDMAGENSACFDIKNRSLEFSARLLEEFLKEKSIVQENLEKQTPIPMSFTQRARYFKTLATLEFSESFNETLIPGWITELSEIGFSQKSMANALIEKMEEAINPTKTVAATTFSKLTRPLTEIGAKALFDKHYEKKKFTLQMEINDQANFDNLKRALDSLNFSEFEKVWNGELDV